MNIPGMKEAGQYSDQQSWTDDELDWALRGSRLALAYLEGRGAEWFLATSKLRLEVLQLETFQEARLRYAKT